MSNRRFQKRPSNTQGANSGDDSTLENGSRVAGTGDKTAVSAAQQAQLLDETVLYGRSTATGIAGGTGDEPIVACVHGEVLYLDLLGLRDAEGLTPFIGDSVTEFARSFATARGYTTSVTWAKLRDFVAHAFGALSNLLAAKRSFDCGSLTSLNGLSTSAIFSQRTYNYSQAWGTLVARDAAVAATVTENPSTSNAVWAQTYLSQLVKLRLPTSYVALAVRLFSVFYNLGPNAGGGRDTYIALWPHHSSAYSAKTQLAQFLDHIAAIDALTSADPDLQSMMDHLGWTASSCLALDFSRDLKGQTFSSLYDEDFLAIIKSSLSLHPSALLTGITVDTDIRTLIIDYSDLDSNFRAYRDSAHFPLSTYGLAMMFRCSSTSDVKMPLFWSYRAGVVESDGTVTWRVILPNTTGTLAFAGALAADAGEITSTASTIFAAQARWGYLVGLDVPYAFDITATGATQADVVLTTTVTNRLKNSHNAYYFEVSEGDVFTRSAMASLLLGAEFRLRLQTLLVELPRSASNIRY